MSVEQLVEDFENHLLRQGRSPGTVKGYDWALRDLLGHLQRHGVTDPHEITGPALEQWQDGLAGRIVVNTGHRMSPRTRQLAGTAARGFLRWAGRRKELDRDLEDAIVTVKAPRLLPRPLPQRDLELILSFLLPRRPRMATADLRTRALFTYLIATGARVSEALQVERDDAERALVVQKGGSQKWLRIPPAVAGYVEDYLKARDDDCPWLWVTFDTNRPVRRLDPAGVREIWIRLAKRVGVRRFTTHQLRHTSATLLLDADVGGLVIADHLGHADLSTVQNYAKVREGGRERVSDVMEQVLGGHPGRPAPRPRLLPSLNPRRRG